MADLILQNNIRWDQELLKQIQRYKQDGTIPQLADKIFSAIALAVSLKAGKITFTNKGTVYEIIPYEDIGERLDSIMADPALAVRGQDHLYKRIQALNLLRLATTLLLGSAHCGEKREHPPPPPHPSSGKWGRRTSYLPW